jgi:hypothetical protein
MRPEHHEITSEVNGTVFKLSVAIRESGPTMTGTRVSGTFSYRSTAWMPESIFMSGAPILPHHLKELL